MKKLLLSFLIAAFVLAQASVSAYADCQKCEKDQAKAKDIVDTAVSAGQFKTLAAALQAAGLVETLKGEGPFTVFAPTDKAFGKLPKGTVEELLKPENKEKLIAVLTYHVVPGKVLAEDVVKLSKAKTVQGSEVKITVKDGKVKVNDAKVTATDIQASNGVIHVINKVILPPEEKKDSARSEAIQAIQAAIHKGSNLYNTGHHGACAELYQETARRLMAMSPSPLETNSHAALQSAVNHSSEMSCSDSKAWAMRRALEKAYASLTR